MYRMELALIMYLSDNDYYARLISCDLGLTNICFTDQISKWISGNGRKKVSLSRNSHRP